MNVARRSLLLSLASTAGLAALPSQPFAAHMTGLPFTTANAIDGGALLMLSSPRHADACISVAQRFALLPVQRFEASPIDIAALTRWLLQRRGALGIALLNQAEHIFVNEAFRLAGSRLPGAAALLPESAALHSGVLAALQAAARTVEPGAPGPVPLIFIA